MYLGGWMDTIRYLLVFFLFFSVTCYADDYPASYKWQCKKTDYNTTSSAFSDSPIYEDYSDCIAAYNANKNNSSFSFQATTYNGYDSVDFYNNGTLFQAHVVINQKFPYCPYGGSTSGDQCISAPSCEGGNVRDPVTGACVPPPPTCPPQGQKRSIAVCSIDSQNESDGTLNINIDGDNSQHTANYDGCVYSYQATDFDASGAGGAGCYAGDVATDGKYEVCCVYNGTSSGLPTTFPDTASLPDDSPSKPVETSDDGKCKSDSKGNEVCSTDGATPSQQCGTVNGAKVCVDTDATKPPTINDKPVDLQGKNCGYVNGELRCVSTTPDSTTTEGCVVDSTGRKFCVNRDTKTTTEEITTTNPDGTITKTVTTKTNTIGEDDKTTTTTTNPDGTKTTTSTGGNGNGDAKTDCDKYPNSIGCQDISKGDAPKADTIPTIDVPIVFNPVSWGGSGSCPAPGAINLHGSTVEISYQPYCDIASAIRPIVIALAFMSAAYIVFGGVKE